MHARVWMCIVAGAQKEDGLVPFEIQNFDLHCPDEDWRSDSNSGQLCDNRRYFVLSRALEQETSVNAFHPNMLCLFSLFCGIANAGKGIPEVPEVTVSAVL